RLRKQMVNVSLLRDVGLHGDSFAAVTRDFADDLVRSRLAGSVIHDDRRAFGGQVLRDGSADAFGCAGDDSDLAGEFFGICVHGVCLMLWFVNCHHSCQCYTLAACQRPERNRRRAEALGLTRVCSWSGRVPGRSKSATRMRCSPMMRWATTQRS